MVTLDAPHSAEPRIPAAAQAMVDLLNSRPHATPLMADTLESPETSLAILRPFGQPDGVVPSTEQVKRIRALRSKLLTVLSVPADQSDAQQGWDAITEYAAAAGFRYVFSKPGQVRLEQVTGDVVIGTIIQSVAELVTANTWTRLRVCANGLCSHVFYDTTRSRTQRWHSYDICGNRHNVASHRARNAG